MIALDEFQEVTELGLGAQFERTMRSVIETQEHVSYIFLGSKTHLLDWMFASKSRPFYSSAQKLLLQKPPADESAEFLVNRFASVDIVLERRLAEKMVERIGNVPYYFQALGSWTLAWSAFDLNGQYGLAASACGFDGREIYIGVCTGRRNGCDGCLP